ncbi:MAG: YggT family protein [Anaerolineales bacterium]|nr:YggT family protein [Anaerolineales bacterium]MCB8954107.1 YggT family protein [Ardenticatenales bacterium]
MLYQVINTIFSLISLLVFVRVLLSWVRVDPYNPLVRMLYEVTDPILVPFQRLIPPAGGLDFSPIIALVVLDLLRRLLLSLV